MEIKILEERTNPLLKRHELRFEVAHATAATPNRDSVRTELAKAVHAPKDRVIIERMNPRFGTAITRGEANIYDSAEAAKSITREHILVRNGLKEKATKAPVAESAAAPSPEAPKAEAPVAPAEPAAAPAAVPAHEKGAAEAPSHAKAAAHPPSADAAGPETPAHDAAAKKGKAHPKKE
ncbi:MAG TPA: hypothetical protein VEH10_04040 [Thermoplasmata archaeon]|nr:hypothetical protein [Thermoplasmata archaeon]